MTKLALLGSKARDELPLDKQGYWILAEKVLKNFDSWHKELPFKLQLAALNVEQPQIGLLQEKSLYIMHMLHMDMRIQLYCQILKDFYRVDTERTETKSRYLKSLLRKVPEHLSDNHTQFAIQIIRVTSILYERSAIATRCWLVIRAVFDACLLLLLSSCMRYIEYKESSRDIVVFTHINRALIVLDFCSHSDIAASRLRDMLEPVIKALSRIGLANALDQGHTTHADRMEIRHIIDQKPEQDLDLICIIEKLFSYASPSKNIWI
ncbi:hypothetical protein BJX66DRAFT_345039 [Aspergillus keveii]|uniref:Uncharacterized protein n=1 Tax=Aspergillus keveii TaxID=714993 RepID=A0ABR4FJ83_9EURO